MEELAASSSAESKAISAETEAARVLADYVRQARSEIVQKIKDATLEVLSKIEE